MVVHHDWKFRTCFFKKDLLYHMPHFWSCIDQSSMHAVDIQDSDKRDSISTNSTMTRRNGSKTFLYLIQAPSCLPVHLQGEQEVKPHVAAMFSFCVTKKDAPSNNHPNISSTFI